MRPIPSVHINAILIDTPSPESLAEFYRAGFDLETPKSYGPDHLGLTLPGGGYLGFNRVAAPEGAPPGRVQIWFHTPYLEITFGRLVRLGAAVKMAPTTEESPGEMLALLTDPEGNVIGLIAPVSGVA